MALIHFIPLLILLPLLFSFASPLTTTISLGQSGVVPEPFYHSRPIYKEVLQKLFHHLSPERMMLFIKTMSEFNSRHAQLNGGEAERWLKQEILTALNDYRGGLAYLKEIKDSSELQGRYYSQKNLIGIVEGQDPELRKNLVILGANYDTFPYYGDYLISRVRSPGADNNASGCAILMEILRLISQFGIQFKNSIEFHFYTGSESGSYDGSRDVRFKYEQEGIIEHIYTLRGVKAMLNVDTVGYQKQKRAIGVCRWNRDGDSIAHPHLTAFMMMLVREYSHYRVYLLSHTDRCVSDHITWNKHGYHAAALTEVNENPKGALKDTPDLINIEQVTEYAKVVLAFVIELGELENFPNVPVPEPTTPESGAQWFSSTTEEPESTDDDFSDDDSAAMKLQVFWKTKMGLILVGIWMIY